MNDEERELCPYRVRKDCESQATRDSGGYASERDATCTGNVIKLNSLSSYTSAGSLINRNAARGAAGGIQMFCAMNLCPLAPAIPVIIHPPRKVCV